MNKLRCSNKYNTRFRCWGQGKLFCILFGLKLCYSGGMTVLVLCARFYGCFFVKTLVLLTIVISTLILRLKPSKCSCSKVLYFMYRIWMICTVHIVSFAFRIIIIEGNISFTCAVLHYKIKSWNRSPMKVRGVFSFIFRLFRTLFSFFKNPTIPPLLSILFR